jgi:hypothetical protein
MSAYALLITMPHDWTENMAEMLGERLATDALPPGVEMVLTVPSVDGEALSETLKEWFV